MSTEGSPRAGRWAWAEVDLAAIEHNVRQVRAAAAPAAVWAVVKADGYGHGAVRAAGAALRAGAAGLCVALVDEGIELRRAGLAAPVLVLSEQPVERLADLVGSGLAPTVYTSAGVDAVAAAARSAGVQVGVHLKVDTGMQRVGVRPAEARGLAQYVADAAGIALAGISTHLACADEPASSASAAQLVEFDRVLADLAAADLMPPLVHVANSAGVFTWPDAHRSFVRAGIAIYGISPGPAVDHLVAGLRPALALKARVSLVKRVAAGSAISYGWRHRFDRDTTIATVPLGYADGVPRRLGTRPDRAGAEVLLGGRRCPIVGVVTMDQLMVDVGDGDVSVGDEVVLIGEQGGHRVGVEEWAEHLGTIGYEIVCGISARVPRIEIGDPDGAPGTRRRS